MDLPCTPMAMRVPFQCASKISKPSLSIFCELNQYFASQMPHVKFILPTAPTQPVTLNMGMAMPSWYDIVGLDERSSERCEGIEQSQNKVLDLIKQEHDNKQVPYSRMALSGFSQGGALALFTGLQMEAHQRLAGILVMSGYLAGAPQFKLTPGLEDVPVLHCHGTLDPVVPFGATQKSKEVVVKQGLRNYTIKSYNIQHTVTPEELEDGM
jgi:lysophospholipase-2